MLALTAVATVEGRERLNGLNVPDIDIRHRWAFYHLTADGSSVVPIWELIRADEAYVLAAVRK